MIGTELIELESMSYSREEVKAITDKVLNMAKADARGGRASPAASARRRATRTRRSPPTSSSTISRCTITVYYGQKAASTSTHQFDDASLKSAIEQAQELAKRRPDNPELMPLVKPPQDYLPVDAALPQAVDFGPAERARLVKQSVDVCEKKGVLGAGYIPKMHWTDALANSEGLFAYNRYAEASFILTCRTPDGTGSGWAGTTGLKDVSKIDAAGADRGRVGQGAEVAQAEGARAGQLHRDPRAAAGGALPVAGAVRAQRARRPRKAAAS